MQDGWPSVPTTTRAHLRCRVGGSSTSREARRRKGEATTSATEPLAILCETTRQACDGDALGLRAAASRTPASSCFMYDYQLPLCLMYYLHLCAPTVSCCLSTPRSSRHLVVADASFGRNLGLADANAKCQTLDDAVCAPASYRTALNGLEQCHRASTGHTSDGRE